MAKENIDDTRKEAEGNEVDLKSFVRPSLMFEHHVCGKCEMEVKFR